MSDLDLPASDGARPPLPVVLAQDAEGDLVMPGIDGWQLLDWRAADPLLARIPVILIAGQANAGETAQPLGLAGSVEKPVNLERLRRALAKVDRADQSATLMRP